MSEEDRSNSIRTALTIAGSDSGGGAGIQADLKTFEAHGVFGMSVLTGVTAQNTKGVQGIWNLPTEAIEAQFDSILDDLPIDAVKIGMLGTPAIVKTVASLLDRLPSDTSIVLDPVMVATSGDRLMEPKAEELLVQSLLPKASVATPNLKEARVIAARAKGVSSLPDAGLEEILDSLQAFDGVSFVVTGIRANGSSVDVLIHDNRRTEYRLDFVESTSTHGTGCTFSSAIASLRARGHPIPDAVRYAKEFVWNAIAAAPGLGAGHGPLWHGHARDRG